MSHSRYHDACIHTHIGTAIIEISLVVRDIVFQDQHRLPRRRTSACPVDSMGTGKEAKQAHETSRETPSHQRYANEHDNPSSPRSRSITPPRISRKGRMEMRLVQQRGNQKPHCSLDQPCSKLKGMQRSKTDGWSRWQVPSPQSSRARVRRRRVHPEEE